MATPGGLPATSLRALRSTIEPGTILLILSGSIARETIPALCHRVDDLVSAHDPERLECDARGVWPVDAVLLDALARLQLTVKRRGLWLRLSEMPQELLELAVLAGLSEALPTS